jgi:hypothetical protein
MFALLTMAFHVRPYTAFALSVVLAGAALWYSRHDRRFFAGVLALAGIFGVITLSSILIYNRIYTGCALISPYAAKVGATTPPELTLNPRLIFYFLHAQGPHTFVDTMFGTFPFLFLLAGCALVWEKESVREVRILAALFVSLVLAYLLHPESSASVYGSRFHYEAFFAIGILGARGLELLVEQRAPAKRAVWAVLFFLIAVQAVHLEGASESLWRRGEPYRKVKSAIAALGGSANLVFLHASEGAAPAFNPKFLNLNNPDWRRAPVVYLIDAEPSARDEWACRFGRPDWVVLGYDSVMNNTWKQSGRSHCPP